jgi:hypothetical protein
LFKKIMVAALAVGALALNAPVAMADDPVYDCGFDSNQQETVTGQNYEGVIYGYIAHGDGTLRCYITVNGGDVGADVEVQAPGAGAERISFAANDTDAVNICWEVTTSHGTETGCAESTHTQIPPQAVIDLLILIAETVDGALVPVFDLLTDIEKTYIDPNVCPALAAAAGTYGPITINSQGDVFIDGEPFWDCPPYDLFS